MNKVDKVVSKVLRIKPNRIKDSTSPMNAKNWDSFGGILLVTEIEKAFRTKFSMKEILSLKDVGSIKKVLKSHGVDPDE